MLDPDVPDLLVAHSGEIDLHAISIPEVALIVQDKASCLPPYLLRRYVGLKSRDVNVVDACAAPGNKTLQLIEYFRN